MILALNLLAGTQQPRRKKQSASTRLVLCACGISLLAMLGWSAYLETRIFLARAGVTQAQHDMERRKPAYRAALDKQAKVAEMSRTLLALQKYSASRFLNAPILNALQQTTVEDIELTRLQTEVAANDPQAGATPRPGRMVLHLEGTDSSSRAGAKIEPFRDMVSTNSYFLSALAKSQGVILKNISPSQLSSNSGRFCVFFKLDCVYPEAKP
jgi:hypothetical protein